jgi:hypothetical protein
LVSKSLYKVVVLQHDFPWWSPRFQADHRGDQPGGEAKLDPQKGIHIFASMHAFVTFVA